MTDSIKVNELKILLVSNKIKQRKLAEKTGLGITSLHNLINNGVGSDKTIKSVVDYLVEEKGLDITEKKVSNMLKKMSK